MTIEDSQKSAIELIGNLFHNTKCGDVVKNQNVIVIDADCTITEGCEILVKNGISSAPVYDKESGSYVGMFDFRDIVDFVLLIFHKKEVTGEFLRADPAEEMTIKDVVSAAMIGKPVTIKVAADLSRKNPFYSVMPESPLLTAVEVFAENEGIHRVNVMDSTSGRVVGVLSQTDIVRFLASKPDIIAPFASKTLKELKIGNSNILHVYSDATVIEALKKMSEYGVTSVAILDVFGDIIGNISMTDVKYIFKHSRFMRLWSSCSQFLSMKLSQEGLENQGKDKFPVFDVTQDCSLMYTIRKALATRVHRVWVVDENRKPIGLITLANIIQAVYKPCKAKTIKDGNEGEEERPRMDI